MYRALAQPLDFRRGHCVVATQLVVEEEEKKNPSVEVMHNGSSSVPSPGFNVNFSDIVAKLEDVERSRYIAKISTIGIYPYLIPNDRFSRNLGCYPELKFDQCYGLPN